MFDFTKIENEELRAELEKEFEVASSKEGLYTQSEFDRKVNEISQKHIRDEKETEKAIRKKIEEDAKLNAEEKASIILQEAEAIKKDVQKRENRMEALTLITEKGIDIKEVGDMIDVLVTDDKDMTISMVTKYVKSYETLQNKAKEIAMKSVENPKNNPNPNAPVDKKAFDSMTFTQKLEYKTENPDMYSKFMSE